MSAIVAQASQVTAPGAGSTAALSVTSTAAVDLSAYSGAYVHLSSDVAFHVRFGSAAVGAAVLTDLRVPADTLVRMYITPGRSYVRAILASGTGTLYYADASDAS